MGTSQQDLPSCSPWPRQGPVSYTDLPAADVAIVLSGTGTVREHVQRLGRILRPQAGKQAVLYELVVADTAEERTSARRREHVAYGAQAEEAR